MELSTNSAGYPIAVSVTEPMVTYVTPDVRY